MKTVVLVMTLLLTGIFASAFVLAEATEEESMDLSEIETLDAETVEMEEAIEEMNLEELEEDQYKRIGFTKIWKGQGWINNGEEGHLLTGFWISQGFAKYDTDEQEVESQKIIRAFGGIHIPGAGKYKLVRAPTSDSIEDVEEIAFYVIPAGKKYKLSKEELTADSLDELSVGKLVLTRENQYKGLVTWKGSLSFDGGKMEGEWDVELATSKKVIRTNKLNKVPEMNERAIESGKKVGFWKKFMFWKKDKPNPQEFERPLDNESKEAFKERIQEKNSVRQMRKENIQSIRAQKINAQE